MTKFSNGGLGVSLLALTMAWPALAQTAPAAEAKADTGQIEDIVVTARRVSESAQKVPLAITVLGDQAIRDSAIKNIRDLQGSAPALFITSGAGGPTAANLAIRGQTQADVLLITDPSVAVYLNEINLPRQIGLRSAFLDLDQVQVLKGPQGTLFGKNTTGGALLLRSKRPDLQQAGGYATATIGNLGTLQIGGAVGVPLAIDKLAVRIAGQVSSRNGLGENAIGQNLGNQNDKSGRVSLLAEPNGSIKNLFTADYTRSRANGSDVAITEVNPLVFTGTTPGNFLASALNEITTELGLPRTVAGYTQAYNAFVGQTLNRGPYFDTKGTFPIFSRLDIYGFSNDLSVELGDITLRSITGYRHTHRDDQQDYDQTSFLLLKPRNYVRSRQFTQEWQALGSVGRLNYIFGAFYSNEHGTEGGNTQQLTRTNPNNPNIQDYTVSNKSYAGFAQLNYEISDTLKATGGVRYTKVTQDLSIRNRNATACLVPIPARPNAAVCEALFDTSSKKPSYLVSLDWQATPDVLLYLKTSSSFRGGGINVRGQSATNVGAFAPFKPERATDYEAGFKGDLLDRHLRINAAGYYTDYSNIQKSSLTVVNNTSVTVISNAAKGKIYGGELELTYRPIEALTLGASGNWTHARYKRFVEANGNDRTGEAFPVPEWQYTLNAKYVVPVGNGDLSFYGSYRWQDDVIYRAEAVYDPTVGQKAYGLVDGRIAYAIGGDPDFEVAVFGKNLFNKKYFTNALNFDASFGYNIEFIGDPRTFGLELRVAFGGK